MRMGRWLESKKILFSLSEYVEEHTQGKKRKMVAEAKAAPFIAKNFGQTREFWDKLNSESQQWLRECMQVSRKKKCWPATAELFAQAFTRIQ